MVSWEDEYTSEQSERIARARARREAHRAKLGPSAMLPPFSFKSELDVLREIGGPIEIEGFPSTQDMRLHFDQACGRFRELAVLRVLMSFRTDLVSARRHWPWVASVLFGYCYKAGRDDDESVDLTPTKIEELLDKIRLSATSLQGHLGDLHQLTLVRREGIDSSKGGHIQFLEQAIVQGVSIGNGNPVDTDPRAVLVYLTAFGQWQKQLAGLVEGTKSAQAILSQDLLTSRNRSRIAGLADFVGRLGGIWTSFIGRKPSAEKVHTRSRSEPRFVQFVQAVADLAPEVHRPTMSQIRSALKQQQSPKQS